MLENTLKPSGRVASVLSVKTLRIGGYSANVRILNQGPIS